MDLFFIIKDKNHNVVSNFVKDNEKDFKIARLDLAIGNIDVYKSFKLSKDYVHFIFLNENVKLISQNPKPEPRKSEPKKPETTTEKLKIGFKDG